MRKEYGKKFMREKKGKIFGGKRRFVVGFKLRKDQGGKLMRKKKEKKNF